jgi:pimeloyl-ACP methyl ester carboxylesterase
MTHPDPQFLTVGTGAAQRRIATIVSPGRPGAAAGLIWLPGFRSEMTSTKASAIAAWGCERGLPVARFDYSGHGQSEGAVENGCVGDWLEEALAVVRQLTRGPLVLVGSSMGGHIALLLLKALQQSGEAGRIAGLVLVAPAWDFTEKLIWARATDTIRKTIMDEGVWMRPSRYGDGPYPITRKLIEDGRRHLIGGAPYDPGCPVRILHGLQDPDVPWEHTLDLEAHLSGNWTRVTAVPDGEHRLSRPEDIALLLQLIEEVLPGAA